MHPHLEGFNLSSSLFKTAQANRMNTNALCVSHKTGNRRIKRFICARVRESTDPVSVRESGKMAVKEKGNYLLHQVRHLSLVPVSYGFSVCGTENYLAAFKETWHFFFGCFKRRDAHLCPGDIRSRYSSGTAGERDGRSFDCAEYLRAVLNGGNHCKDESKRRYFIIGHL